MKQLLSVLIAAVLAITVSNAQSKTQTIKELTSQFLKASEGEISESTPIESVNKLANDQANKIITLSKENIQKSLEQAKEFKYCLITVSGHTIVKVTDLNKTLMSGSWGCKMPFGVGYVQKGILNKKEDFINNIIGIPSSQKRMMYLFN